jgi:endosialidase-like protein
MKKAFVFLVMISLCGAFPLAHSDQAMAQTAGSAAKNDQDLAKENEALRRQNAELRERLRRLESAKGTTSAATNIAKPQSSQTSAMAADLPVKGRVAQPAALQQVSGYVEMYTGAAWAKDSVVNPNFAHDWGFNGWVLGGAGRANWWVAPNISMQFDAQAEGTRYKIPTDELAPGFSGKFSTLSYLVGVHANWRDPRTGLFGVFGGIGDAGGNIATLGANNSGVRHGVVGLEGQYYWNALTLYGQGGYDALMNIGNVALWDNAHAWFVRGTGRYFFSPNFMLEGTGQYAKGAAEYTFFNASIPNADFNTWLWRVKAEWKPDTMPFSLFATYEGSRTSYASNVFFGTTSERVTDNRVMAGLRLYMGQDTLLSNDRTGATLDIIDPLGAPTSPAMIFPTGQVIFVSDARLKRDIALVGRLKDGLGLYRYRYLWDDTIYVGVMAQEVAFIHPDAVIEGTDGYLRVNYSRLGLKLMTLTE